MFPKNNAIDIPRHTQPISCTIRGKWYLVGDARDERLNVDGSGTRQLAGCMRALETAASLANRRTLTATKCTWFNVCPPAIQQTVSTSIHDARSILSAEINTTSSTTVHAPIRGFKLLDLSPTCPNATSVGQ